MLDPQFESRLCAIFMIDHGDLLPHRTSVMTRGERSRVGDFLVAVVNHEDRAQAGLELRVKHAFGQWALEIRGRPRLHGAGSLSPTLRLFSLAPLGACAQPTHGVIWADYEAYARVFGYGPDEIARAQFGSQLP
jgi:hypothetical protein